MQTAILQLIILLATTASDDIDDPELLLAIKNGKHDAFKTFFDKYHKHLYYFLLKKGASEDTSKDLIQQAFVMIWEKRASIDENKSLRSYLFRIAYTRLLNLYRDSAKFDNTDHIDIEDSDSTKEEEDRSETLKVAIENAISSMPKKRQEVFRLCFIQEFTYRECAEVLDVSIKTIENHMGLALKDLRASLEKYR